MNNRFKIGAKVIVIGIHSVGTIEDCHNNIYTIWFPTFGRRYIHDTEITREMK